MDKNQRQSLSQITKMKFATFVNKGVIDYSCFVNKGVIDGSYIVEIRHGNHITAKDLPLFGFIRDRANHGGRQKTSNI